MPIDDVTGLLDRAREAFGRRDWVGARDGFTAARQHETLTANDVYALGDAVWWLGFFREAGAATRRRTGSTCARRGHGRRR